jgi:hypothetical protein
MRKKQPEGELNEEEESEELTNQIVLEKEESEYDVIALSEIIVASYMFEKYF